MKYLIIIPIVVGYFFRDIPEYLAVRIFWLLCVAVGCFGISMYYLSIKDKEEDQENILDIDEEKYI